MDNQVLHDPALTRFRAALTEIYGERLERAVLFGSRARGDARPDSDYDIALFLHDFTTFWDETAPTADGPLTFWWTLARKSPSCPFGPVITGMIDP